MARRVEGVTEKLLECAKEEFLINGYEKASLRVIAEKAGSSKGAIYIRYPDKESLYRALVDPIAECFCNLLELSMESFNAMSVNKQQEQVLNYSDKGFPRIINYVYDNFSEFKLLLTSGENNAAQEFLHKVVDIDVAATLKFIEATGNDAISSGRLTLEVAHLLSSAFYSGFFDVVVHDMPREMAIKHIQSMRSFYNAGWKSIFDGPGDNDHLGQIGFKR